MVEEPIPDNLSISVCTRREICGETELNLCKHKNEEECKKLKIQNPKMNIFSNIKNVNFSFGPIPVT